MDVNATLETFMHAELSQLLGMLSMSKANRKISGKVLERVKSRKCLNCENPAKRRGLCNQCYLKFRNKKAGLESTADRLAFEMNCVQAGKILAVGKVRELRTPNPFSDVEAGSST
jgi:hypothetical protein